MSLLISRFFNFHDISFITSTCHFIGAMAAPIRGSYVKESTDTEFVECITIIIIYLLEWLVHHLLKA